MTTIRLIDPLPLCRPYRMGLTHHGLVRNNVLTKVNGGLVTYLSPVGGEAIPVAGHNAELPVRTPEQVAADRADGQDWRAYAYLSGSNRDIGGHALGENCWLYDDGKSIWQIRAQIVRLVYDDISVRVYLTKLFGRFSNPRIELPAERLLGSVPFEPKQADWSGEETAYVDWYYPMDVEMTLFAYPKKDGSAALLSIGYGDIGAQRLFPQNTGPLYSRLVGVPLGNRTNWYAYINNTEYGDWSNAHLGTMKSLPNYSYLFGVIRVTLSGEGSLEEGLIGNGITATVEVYKQMPDLFTMTYGQYPFRGGVDPTPLDPVTGPPGNTTTVVHKFLWTYHPVTQEEQFATWTHTEQWVPDFVPGQAWNFLVTVTDRVDFAGQLIEYQYVAGMLYSEKLGYLDTPGIVFGAEGTTCEHCLPWIAIDTAYGDRATLLVEQCLPVYNLTATINTNYVSVDGTRFNYATTASAVGTGDAGLGYLAPSLAKTHGQISTSPMEGKIATAGEVPLTVCYV